MNKKKIAIIEVYSHHVFVHTIASTLREAGHIVDIYVNERIYKDLKPLFSNSDGLNFILPNKKESDYKFLSRTKKEIEQNNDLLIINTIQGYRILFFYILNYKIPTIAAAGRISEFFGSKYKLRGFKTIRRLLHHNFTRFFLPRIIKRLNGIIVHTEQAQSFARKHGYKNLIHKMPFSLNLNKDLSQKDKLINFLVTGSIDDTSRDYESLLNVFEKVWQDGILSNKLTILSSPRGKYGKKIYIKMVDLKEKGYPIYFFSDWIPENEYINCSKNADFLIAPILKEYYNKGELTSVTVESIRMGLPAIYPEWYKPDSMLEESSIYYSSFEDLYEIIKQLNNNDQRLFYKNLAKNSFEKLNVINESERIKLFIREIS